MLWHKDSILELLAVYGGTVAWLCPSPLRLYGAAAGAKYFGKPFRSSAFCRHLPEGMDYPVQHSGGTAF